MKRGVKIIAALFAAQLMFCPLSYGQNADPVSEDEQTELFTSFCIKAFPDDQKLSQLAAQKNATVMQPAEVAKFLHLDPGHGWYLHTSEALYVITIEHPPYHACAIRRMTPSGVAGVLKYIAAVKAHAQEQNAALSNIAPVKQKSPSGMDISAYGYTLAQPGSNTVESFFVIMTNYHGHVPEQFRKDAQAGVGVEVRFVRQITQK